MLDSGAANLEEGWTEKKRRARLRLVHFHTCWSLDKYVNLEEKNSGSAKISSMYVLLMAGLYYSYFPWTPIRISWKHIRNKEKNLMY